MPTPQVFTDFGLSEWLVPFNLRGVMPVSAVIRVKYGIAVIIKCSSSVAVAMAVPVIKLVGVFIRFIQLHALKTLELREYVRFSVVSLP